MGQVIFGRYIKRLPSTDFEVIFAYFFANQTPKYEQRYVPYNVALLVVLERNGEVMVLPLLSVGPGDD